MVAEPWINKIRSKVKDSSAAASASATAAAGSGANLGILSFEVAGAMSRASHLLRSLSDAEISRLRSQTFSSYAVRSLVSDEDSYLFSLAAAEFLDDLNRIAAVAARLGRRCLTAPALLAFDHVYSDLLAGCLPPSKLPPLLLPSNHSTSALRKMEQLVASTTSLYAELEALEDLEQSSKKLPADSGARKVFDQKILWQRRLVHRLRYPSLWCQTYEKAALLLAKSVCSIYSRIRIAFGDTLTSLESKSEPISSTIHTDHGDKKHGQSPPQLKLNCGGSPGKLFFECLSLNISSAVKDVEEDQFEDESFVTAVTGPLVPNGVSGILYSGDPSQCKNSGSWFGPKSKLASLAPPSTVGGSALALHYANIIIIIENLLKYPHLVGEEARDGLYSMLPSSLRTRLRKMLKSYVKNLAIYDAPLAHDWKVTLDKILSWLAPMAHNMIRWQTERGFEQQQIVSGGNVLLLETLYFADREKTETAISELLVGLNYICRCEQQQNALLDCATSMDFDDCIDWRSKY